MMGPAWRQLIATILARQVPAQEGVIVKDTPTPKVARIVVDGHSEFVSYLGPSSEEPVTELLRQLGQSVSIHCGHQGAHMAASGMPHGQWCSQFKARDDARAAS